MVDLIPPQPVILPPAPLSPVVPLNPPMVGFANPFDHVDGQNRDMILEAIRAWARESLRGWTGSWQTYLVDWFNSTEGWLRQWDDAVVEYVTDALDGQLEANEAALDAAVDAITDALASSDFFGGQTVLFNTNHAQMMKGLAR